MTILTDKIISATPKRRQLHHRIGKFSWNKVLQSPPVKGVCIRPGVLLTAGEQHCQRTSGALPKSRDSAFSAAPPFIAQQPLCCLCHRASSTRLAAPAGALHCFWCACVYSLRFAPVTESVKRPLRILQMPISRIKHFSLPF